MSKCAYALLLLGISPPYTADDVARAYKRLAREKHPDAGGSHDDFIRLKEARDVALRGY
jgi:curved DNA-binding protein CbpA